MRIHRMLNIEEINTILDASKFAEGGTGTESSPWINAVSNAFRALPDEGGVIWLPAGRYEQNEGYTIDKHHQLYGAGAGNTQIDRADGLDEEMFLFDLPSGVRGFTFPGWQEVIVDGRSDRAGDPLYLLRSNPDGDSLRDFWMRQVWVEDAPNSGAQFDGHATNISHCAFEHCGGIGLYLISHEDGVVRGSRIRSNDGDGIYVDQHGGRRSIKITGNDIANNGNIGVRLDDWTIVSHNGIKDNDIGARVSGNSEFARLENNFYSGDDQLHQSLQSGADRYIINI